MKVESFSQRTFKVSGSLMDGLLKLEAGQGREAAQHLKMKYWTGTSHQEFTGSVLPAKSRSEISQRFFTSDDNDIISSDEAYRFLQNKWMEKVRLSKMKHHSENGDKGQETNSDALASGGLIGKRKAKRNGSHKGK